MKKTLLICLFAVLVISCLVACDETTFPSSYVVKTQTAKSNAYGMVGSAVAKAIAKQPEAEEEIQYFASVAGYYIEKANDKAEGVGTVAQGSISSIAKQPEAFYRFLENLLNTCETIIGSTDRYGVEDGIPTATPTDLKPITDISTNDKYDTFINDEVGVSVLVSVSGTEFTFQKEDATSTVVDKCFIYLK